MAHFRFRYAQQNRTRADFLLEIALGFDDVEKKFGFLLNEHGEGRIPDGEFQFFDLRQGSDAVFDFRVHIRRSKKSALLTKTIEIDFTSVDFALLLQFVHVTFGDVRQVLHLEERRVNPEAFGLLSVPDSLRVPRYRAWECISP